MKMFFFLLIVVFSFLGIFDAGYITYSEFNGVVPQCQPPFACETVLKSKWSHIGPIPLAVVGLIFYSMVLIFGALSVLEVSKIQLGEVTIYTSTVVFLFGSMGVAFSVYLLFLMGIILKAWCLYCLLSATNCGILFILSMVSWKVSGFRPLATKDSDALLI